MTRVFTCSRLARKKTAAAVSMVVLVALVASLMVTVLGCGGGLEGTWVSDEEGTAVITGDKIKVSDSGMDLEFTYKVDGDNLLLTLEGLVTDQPVPYKLDGDTLTLNLEGDSPVVFTRK